MAVMVCEQQGRFVTEQPPYLPTRTGDYLPLLLCNGASAQRLRANNGSSGSRRAESLAGGRPWQLGSAVDEFACLIKVTYQVGF